MSYETILYEKKGKVAYITLNRPESLNAVNPQMAHDLDDVFDEFDQDDEAHVAILSGNGRCFCAGADAKVFSANVESGITNLTYSTMHSRKDRGFLQSQNYKPIIAAVHGYCYGSGLGLILGADILVVTEDAKFQITEVQRGLGGGFLGVQMSYAGLGRVGTELAITGRALSGAEAYRLGFANKLVSTPDDLLSGADEFAASILEQPPLAVRANVRACRESRAALLGMMRPAASTPSLRGSEDYREATRAFIEKRKPNFVGR